MKQLVLIVNVFFLFNISLHAQQTLLYKPVDQPDADGRIIKGREGTHHWRPYMQNADLSDYHHASEEAVRLFFESIEKGENFTEKVVLPTKLVVRESSVQKMTNNN